LTVGEKKEKKENEKLLFKKILTKEDKNDEPLG
jgi:hypothetical protein